jgi:hypothetical protein
MPGVRQVIIRFDADRKSEMTKRLELTLAGGLYGRMLDLYRGDVQPDGIMLNFIPMDGSARVREIFERHDAFGDVRSQRRDARGACLIVQEAIVTRRHEAFLPAPHTGLRLAGPAHDLIGANNVGAQQDDLSPPDMLVRGVAIPRERLQATAIGRLESDGNSGSHAPDSHAFRPAGIPSGIQMSDAIH